MQTKARWTAGMLALAMLASMAITAQARVTEKVEAMIAENTPLKVNDNDVWFMVGGPLVFGLQYDKYINAQTAVGGGVGGFMDGFALDMGVKYNVLPGKVSPFLGGGGVFYYVAPEKNVFALFGTGGVGVALDGGLGFSVAFTYVKSVSQSMSPFSTVWVNNEINWPSAQFGFHVIF